MILAWIVLIISAAVFLGFIVLMFMGDWRAALLAIAGTLLIFCAATGLSWAVSVLVGA
ncbi:MULTISPECIES: hypothetical protein [Leuconostoc]|uniref:hypothetical protein n=1 Tax=Leuconostoc TaxID=1243 RepID=UPI0032DE99AA